MYCTIQDIADDITELTLIELTDDNKENSVNEDIVNAKISANSIYIDSYIQSSYTLPIADNLILKNICISLVVCDLYQRRLGLDYSESLVNRRSVANKTLEKIQSGVITLVVISNEEQSSFYLTSKTNRHFSDDILDRF